MLTLNIHCSLIADSLIISKLSYCHLKEVSNDLKYENIQFNLEHKTLDRDNSADLAIDSWINKTRMDVDKLLENNNDIKDSLEEQIRVSQTRWEQVSLGAYPWEQILSWIINGLICCTLFSLIGWTIKLQIAQWKLPGTMVTERGRMKDRSNNMIRELRDKMDNIITDTGINMRLLTKKHRRAG